MVRNRTRRRGIILIVAAIALAVGALGFALTMETGERFLEWKLARRKAEAAAVAAAWALDGTADAEQRARAAAGAELWISPQGVRAMVQGVSAFAEQRAAEPLNEPELTMAAPEPDASGFGLMPGQTYTAEASDSARLQLGRVVAVQVHSGAPKALPLSWIAGRVLAVDGGSAQIEYLGGYLRGARHAAAQPYGYFEVALAEGGR